MSFSPRFVHCDRQVGDINADPLPAKFLRRSDARAAAAERIQHHVTRVGRGIDDALEQGKRFLGGITKTLCSHRIYRWNICPDILKRSSWHLI